MSITTTWVNEEQTILLISYQGIIAERDFVEAMDQVHTKITGRTHPVHIVHDFGSSNAQELLSTYPRKAAVAS